MAPPADAQAVEEVLADLLATGRTSGADGSVHRLAPVSIPAAQGRALRDRVVRERAERTVEVGLGYGVSALFLCHGLAINGLPGARHVALDPYQASRFADCGRRALARAGVADLVEFHAEESQTALPRFLSQGRGFDLAFVDGNHRFDYVFLDLVYLGRLLRGGGALVLDDYQLPGVARAASFCLANLGWTLEELSPPDALHRWAVLRTPLRPAERPFEHFVDF